MLAILTSSEQKSFRGGRFFASINKLRTRGEVFSMFDELGCYQEQAYRMNADEFMILHEKLLPELTKKFLPSGSMAKLPTVLLIQNCVCQLHCAILLAALLWTLC